jgi:2-polyprenyl-3-methyl-5-hydroxy-6-metoxy-1,4-benzoquinol methylase
MRTRSHGTASPLSEYGQQSRECEDIVTEENVEDYYMDYDKFMLSKRNYLGNEKKNLELYVNYYTRNYLRYLPKDKRVKIIDIGCGRGDFLLFLKRNGYANIEGIDLDGENVRHCRKCGLNVNKMDLFKFVEKVEGQYSVIVMNDVIEHIERHRVIPLLKRLRSKLEDGGSLFIKTVNCNNVYGLSAFFSDFTHLVGYTEEKIEHIALLGGFRSCDVKNLFIYPGVPLVDPLLCLFYGIWYRIKRLLFLLNGRKNVRVFSKNLLAILKK